MPQLRVDQRLLVNGNGEGRLARLEEALREGFARVEGKVDGIHTELGGLGTEIDGIRTELGGLGTEIDGIRTELGGLGTEIGGIRTELGGLGTEVDGIRTEIDGLRGEVDGFRQELTAHLAGTTDSFQAITEALEALHRTQV